MIDLTSDFAHHPPGEISDAGRDFAEIVTAECPTSRERSLAIIKIEEAVMWACAAKARHE